MFAPNKEEVRRFFCDTWRKARSGDLLTPMEAIARDWMLQHPEYASELSDLDAALSADYDAAYGKANPFLHLSMHLSISEQISIDQPPGLRDAWRDGKGSGEDEGAGGHSRSQLPTVLQASTQ